jgi:hypothetical protein
MFIFLDESGDLGFDWSKRGTSPCFVITLLVCDSNDVVKQINKAVKRTLKNKVNTKRTRKEIELKGTNTRIIDKQYFYERLPQEGWRLYAVTLDKKHVEPFLQTKEGKPRLYNYLSRFLLEKIPFSAAHSTTIHLSVDRCKTAAEMEDFNTYLQNQLQGLLPLETPLYIDHDASHEKPCLQAVDLFCWGVRRKALGDAVWFDMFKERLAFHTLCTSDI